MNTFLFPLRVKFPIMLNKLPLNMLKWGTAIHLELAIYLFLILYIKMGLLFI